MDEKLNPPSTWRIRCLTTPNNLQGAFYQPWYTLNYNGVVYYGNIKDSDTFTYRVEKLSSDFSEHNFKDSKPCVVCNNMLLW